MTESSTLWGYIRPRLAPYGLLERMEPEPGKAGRADLNYVILGHEGWVELKYLPEWPKRITSKILLPHFVYPQLRWAEARHKAGGRAGLLAQVARSYFFFEPPAMRAVYNGVSRPEFARLALVQAEGYFPLPAMIKALTRPIIGSFQKC